MSEWWVREHWSRAFEILAIAPQFQNFSWALMRRREVELTTEDVERPSADPREFAALCHNLRQLQREVIAERSLVHELHLAARAEQAELYERRIREYEDRLRIYQDSLSWRVTQPVRRAAETRRARRAR